ncbi:hypothetical protein BKA65DRAFT_608914 [Rhexocercosporidium sp. MPI-PUGE-AT-0058]|nr:hypothetical protein BKA65DRAFT_608914 [Rhexocercosporidium sp. MPI-PUGE-AT-0058]
MTIQLLRFSRWNHFTCSLILNASLCSVAFTILEPFPQEPGHTHDHSFLRPAQFEPSFHGYVLSTDIVNRFCIKPFTVFAC